MYEKKRLSYQGDEISLDGILHKQIVDFLPKKKYANILDYGAGNSPYRDYIKHDFYRTADISQNLAGDIDHLLIDSPHVPLPDKSIDLILLMDVLEHIDEPAPVLTELRRLLSTQGRLIISIPFMYREHETPNDYYRYTIFGLEKLIAKHGGRIVRMRKVGNIWYTLLSLFMERNIFHGEKNTLNLPGKLINKICRLILPIFFYFLAARPDSTCGIYHHLLLEVEFT